MELGKTKLLRHGANVLRQALHPVYGLAWTDGRRVMLTRLRLGSSDASHEAGVIGTAVGVVTPTGPVPPGSPTSCSLHDTSIIGTFEHVWDLCWGASCCHDSAALLAVQHKRHATVLLLRRVAQLPADPAAEASDPCANLLVSQTCEVAVRQLILPQGCVWHPSGDALVVLTDAEVWLLPAARQGNSRLRVPLPHRYHHQRPHQLGHPCCLQAVRCAAWSEGGRSLVVAAGASIFHYEWDEARRLLSPCATCPVFHLGGLASAMLPVGKSLLVVALEAPRSVTATGVVALSCGRNASSQVSLVAGVEPGLHKMLPEHLMQHGSTDASCCEEPAYSAAAATRPSPSSSSSSTLLLVSLDGSRGACGARRVLVPGLAVPDLVAFEPRSGTLLLASNAAGLVSLFTLGPPHSLVASGTIRLASEETVKGACFAGERTLLLASGRLRQTDASPVSPSPPTPPPPPPPFSYTSKYSLRILAQDLPTPAEDERRASTQSTASSSRSSLNYMQVNADSKDEDDLCSAVNHEVLAESPTAGDSEPAATQGKRSKRAGDGQAQEHTTCQTDLTKLLMNNEHHSGGNLTWNPDPSCHHDSREDLGPYAGHAGPSAGHAGPSASPLLRCSPRGSLCGSLNELFTQLRRSVQLLNSNLVELTVHLVDRPDVAPSATSRRPPGAPPNRGPTQRPPVGAGAGARDSPPGCAAKEPDASGPRVGVGAVQAAGMVERAEWVRVTCQNGSDGNETRIFLLVGRRLHLGIIKEVFALCVAEIQTGETWMILGADENDFIPLTFDSGTEVVVREGTRRVRHGNDAATQGAHVARRSGNA